MKRTGEIDSQGEIYSQNFTITACYQEGVRRHIITRQLREHFCGNRREKGKGREFTIYSKRGVPRVKIKAVNKATAERKREKWIGMISGNR